MYLLFIRNIVKNLVHADGFLENGCSINRIAATCTQNVSSTIHEKIFNDVIKYLENEKIIQPGSVSSRKTWFSKNRELMKIINEQLEGLLVDGKPLDKYQKAIFVWHIKEYCIYKKREPRD